MEKILAGYAPQRPIEHDGELAVLYVSYFCIWRRAAPGFGASTRRERAKQHEPSHSRTPISPLKSPDA